MTLIATFSVISARGGVGKTVFTTAIARALTERIKFRAVKEPRVLVVDLDMHTTGLTFLLAGDLSKLPKQTVVNWLLGKVRGRGRSSESIPNVGPFEVSKHLSLLPATNLKDRINWSEIHDLDAIEIGLKIKAVIDQAEKEGFNFVIFDTRAGQDSLSLGVTLATNASFLIFEQGLLSQQGNIRTVGELKYYREFYNEQLKHDFPEKAPQDAVTLFFVENMIVQRYGRDTKDVMKTFGALTPIPFDLNMKRSYVNDPFQLAHDTITKTRFGRHAQQVLSEALWKMGISHAPSPDTAIVGIRIGSSLAEFINLVSPFTSLGIGTALLIAAILVLVGIFPLESLLLELMIIFGIFLVALGWLHAWLRNYL